MGENAFGNELSQVLAERSATERLKGRWTTARLAAALDVDASLIRKWLRGDRVPALNKDYLQRIAEALALGGGEVARLRSAQIAALEAQPPRRGRSQGRGGVQELIAGATQIRRTAPLATSDPPTRLTAGVTRGTGALIERGIELLQNLPPLDQPHTGTVLITHQGTDTLFHARAGLAQDWRAALAGVLQRGWDLEQLWRVERDPGRAVLLVERMLSLLGGPGEYRPRYFVRAGRLSSPYEVLAVPGYAAMLSFATRQPGHIDSSLVVDDPAGVAMLRDHFYQLRRETRQFLTVFLRGRRVAFNEALTEAARKGGDRRTFRNGLSLMTAPHDWLREDSFWIRSRASPGWDAGALLGTLRERMDLWEDLIRTAPCRDVVPIQAIRHWLQTGRERWTPFAESPDRIGTCEVPERRRWVEHVLDTLERFPKYELALWDEEVDGPLPTTFWQVVGDHTAQMVAWSGTPDGEEEMLVTISEPRIVAAFRYHFDRVWEGLPPERRDKGTVAELLRREMEAAPAR